ncbi:membrane protein YoeI [Atlantibacter hermannii]|uniref:Membrane protein YoeI n=1 Tax=Atlantibacter subterraneus TaxID=255519 RepID=A0A3R9F9Z7_9ENTR|nr:membrane protein YoeI [Atlantibacter hermannii]RSB64668.1 membrane protein YoeI [Atlantibacter subterranea]MBL7675362.1 membrane protein YoeI [Atlantibacter hermannii]NBC97458.1 membrane protein YoeI [Atlantibacter hermannii]RSE08005.1 membrane protein YoeI [Atlantibacter subterranea]
MGQFFAFATAFAVMGDDHVA